MMTRSTIALAAFALLAACGSDDPSGEQAGSGEGGEVTGDVLGGSISDDMIALDQLTSTSPPAEPTGGPDGEASTEVTRTTSVSTSGEEGPPPPAQPEPPTVPDEAE